MKVSDMVKGVLCVFCVWVFLIGAVSADIGSGFWYDKEADPVSSLELGTWEEAYDGGAAGEPGNVLSAEGDSGQWEVSGLTLTGSPVPIDPIDDAIARYKTEYTGGTLALEADGWADGTIMAGITGTVYSNHYDDDSLESVMVFQGTVQGEAPYSLLVIAEVIRTDEDAEGHNGDVTRALLYLNPAGIDLSLLETIHSLLTDESIGLEEIKAEIIMIEQAVTHETYGLQALYGLISPNLDAMVSSRASPEDLAGLATEANVDDVGAKVDAIQAGIDELDIPNIDDLALEASVQDIISKIDDEATGLVEIKTEIAAIEAAVSNPDEFKADVSDLAEEASVQAILDLILSPTFGIEEIKDEVRNIEDKLPEDGIADEASVQEILNSKEDFKAVIPEDLATESEAGAIESKLDDIDLSDLDAAVSSRASASAVADLIDILEDPAFGLEEIKDEVRNIEDEVMDEEHGLQEIKTEIIGIESRLLELEGKITSMDGKLDQVLGLLNPDCGNGDIQPGEQCDDGNNANGDGCDSNCRLEVCGNGIVQSGEDCDDENSNNNDGCKNDCTYNVCGDGVLYTGVEQCEDNDDCGAEERCTGCQCRPVDIECSQDSDCGTDSFIGMPYCVGFDVTQVYREYTCYLPGTEQSYCDHTEEEIAKETCSNECRNGECVALGNVVFRTNAEGGDYQEDTWIAVDTDEDGIMEGYEFTGASGTVYSCHGAKLVETPEGYGVYDSSRFGVYVCMPDGSKFIYRKYSDDSDDAVTGSEPTEPYTGNGQETYI